MVESIDENCLMEKFDAVIACEVIEHLGEVGQFFDIVHRLLKPGGVLYLTTPNFNSLSRYLSTRSIHLCYPEHLCSLSKRTIHFIAHRYGFDVLSMKAHGVRFNSLICLRDLAYGKNANASKTESICTNLATRESELHINSRSAGYIWRIFKLTKAVANIGLNTLSLGETLKVYMRKAVIKA